MRPDVDLFHVLIPDLPLGHLLIAHRCASARASTLASIRRREIVSEWVPAGSATGEDEWVALALEAGGPGSAIGTGTSPEQALANLAERLRQMRGNPNG